MTDTDLLVLDTEVLYDEPAEKGLVWRDSYDLIPSRKYATSENGVVYDEQDFLGFQCTRYCKDLGYHRKLNSGEYKWCLKSCRGQRKSIKSGATELPPADLQGMRTTGATDAPVELASTQTSGFGSNTILIVVVVILFLAVAFHFGKKLMNKED